MEKMVLGHKDIDVGVPVDWNIYDRNGRLLLRQGMVLQSDKQIHKVITYGAYRIRDQAEEPVAEQEVETNESLSPFDNINNAVKELYKILKRMLREVADPNANMQNEIYGLSSYLIELCEYDLDATVGAMHLGQIDNYSLFHPICKAVLSNVIAEQLKLDTSKRLSVVSAALTANLGMFDLQHTLLAQQEPLTKTQREKIEKHPAQSAVLLKHWGIKDRLWLQAVLQHHEKQDGSGYPRKLKGDEIKQESRIISIADRYHALLAPRKYREGFLPTDAIRHLFKDRGKEIDEELTLLFVREVGIYPPGTMVKLKNGETAIVVRRGDDHMKPIVKCVLNDRGIVYPKAITRDTSSSLVEITGMCPPLKKYKPDLKELWDYKL